MLSAVHTRRALIVAAAFAATAVLAACGSGPTDGPSITQNANTTQLIWSKTDAQTKYQAMTSALRADQAAWNKIAGAHPSLATAEQTISKMADDLDAAADAIETGDWPLTAQLPAHALAVVDRTIATACRTTAAAATVQQFTARFRSQIEPAEAAGKAAGVTFRAVLGLPPA